MMQKPDVRMQDALEDEMDLGEVLATLWAGKPLIAATSVVAMLAAVGYLAVTPPTYEADALLQIESRKGNMLALPSSMSDLLGTENASTMAEMEIIKSRHVLGRAVADLNLDWRAEPKLLPLAGHALTRFDVPLPEYGPTAAYARKGDSIKLAYLEVPPEWLNEEMVVEKTSDTRFSLTLPDGTVKEGQIGQLLSDKDKGVALQLGELVAPVGRQFLVTQKTELAAIADLGRGLEVSERGRQTGIVDVRLRGENPKTVALELNAVIRAYVEQNISKSAAEAQKSLAFVESQLPLAEAAVQDAERKLNDYRSAQQSVDLEFETQSLLTEATGIESQLRELTLKEEELKEKYTPNHPVYRQLLEERAALQTRLGELQGGISALPETQREVVNLTRNLDVAQATYVELMNRAQELRVLSASQIGSVRIIDDAATKAAPVAPRSLRVLALAVALGVAGGIGGVLLRNWLRRGIDSVAEIERLGVPVFATINKYDGAVRPSGGRLPLIAREDSDDVVVEAFRSLRTSLHFGMLDARSKSIVITSAAPGAGKSFVSVNLAYVAAQAGQRVCLIDADMRRGTQRKYFGLPKKLPGLADYLAEDSDLDAVLRESGFPNLSLIMTGAFPPNPSELLMRKRLKELVDALDQRFDLVIFDAPPMLAVTDAAVMGRHAGSVIAVARHLVTPPGELEAVKKTLETAGVPLKGAIFNGFDPRRAKSGGRRYGYGYGYGYANRYAYKRGGGGE